MAYMRSELGKSLPLVASGKVRELYEVDPKTLLFVASDRISAYDVIMKNVSSLLALKVNMNPSLMNAMAFTRVFRIKVSSSP